MHTTREIKSGEYEIVEPKDNITFITQDLGNEIVLWLFSIEPHKVGIGRNLNEEKFKEFFTNFDLDVLKEPIKVSLIGGNDSKETEDYATNLVNWLQRKDANRDIIDIISFDVGNRLHPDSITFDSYSGLFSQYSSSALQIREL